MTRSRGSTRHDGRVSHSGHVARRAVVRGRVQGVFFRDSTRRQAVEAGVVGWVRNDPEGTVTAHLEGPEGAVDAVVSWLYDGPPGARVTDVYVTTTESTDADSFDVVG